MRASLALSLALIASCSGAAERAPPLRSGTYMFQHRYAEQPAMPSFSLKATIRGKRIVLINPAAAGPFPAGVVAEGELMWHPASGQWIIGTDRADRSAPDVGGCSDGPEVVDLARRIYWTC